MEVIKKIGEALLLAGFSFLLFMLLFESRLQLPPWVQVIGRMHPLFLHFPIVFLLLYLSAFWMPVKASWVQNLGLLAALTAMLAAIMGLLLAQETTWEGSNFSRHKWGGVAIAVCSFLLYHFHPFLARKKWVA